MKRAVKGAAPIFRLRKTGAAPCAATLLFLSFFSAAAHAQPVFSDDFEKHPAGQLPGAPWKEETYKSGAIITVDSQHAFSGQQALHIFNPRGAKYRRGYVAIHLGGPLPALQPGMYGRAMVWLDAAPESLPGAPPVQWTLLQGEGRDAADRYNSIYRVAFQERDGLQLMANFETTPPVTTDCKRQTTFTIPVRAWACVEWRFVAATNEMQIWMHGRPAVHLVQGRADAPAQCKGDDLGGEWRAPPKFDSFYLGFERYADSVNDQNLWIDDVVLAHERVGCPVGADVAGNSAGAGGTQR